jgi:hypothetical protein
VVGSQWRYHGSCRSGDARRTLGQRGYAHRNDLAVRPTAARLVRNERIDADEIMLIDGVLVTTPARDRI